jgi:hypothetical protein
MSLYRFLDLLRAKVGIPSYPEPYPVVRYLEPPPYLTDGYPKAHELHGLKDYPRLVVPVGLHQSETILPYLIKFV